MNVYDSLKIQELLGSIGFSDSSSFFDADLIILNTCHIREKATEKVYSELGKIKKSFKNDIEFGRKIIAVMGCVAQAEGDEIFKRTPYVDIVIGPQSVHNLPTLVTEAMERRNKRKSLKLIDVDFPARNKFNYFKHNKPQGASAYITIQEGCDKFCNFCVVPYTRGEEFSRPIEDVYLEANNLVALGSREIILLGQNVTAYHGKDFSGKEQGIHKLIEKLAKIKDLRRIRYITSHPLDIDQNIISIHGTEKKLMPFLHLPIQSGSNKILRSMNRKYTVEDYISIVKKFRAICPDMQFSSDFIVGYPGESEQDFQATIRLVKKIKFAQSFSFKFSPRAGTPSAESKEQVDPKISSKRLSILQNLLNSHQSDFNRSSEGKIVPVLIEGEREEKGKIFGRTPCMQMVNLNGSKSLVGKIVDVKIEKSGKGSLGGHLANSRVRNLDIDSASTVCA